MKKKVIFFSLFMVLMSNILSVQRLFSKNITEEDQLILVGIGAYKDGFYDIAEKQFSQFVRDYPNHGKVYDVSYLLGKTFLNKGKLKEARKVFLKIIHESKNFEHMDYAFFWAAAIEMKLGNGGEAQRLLLSMINKFPKFEWLDHSYFLLGLLDFGSNRPIQAESSFEKVSLLSKSNQLIRSSWFWLGLLSYKKKNYEAAANYFKAVWEEPEGVPREYLRHALLWLGESQLKLARFHDVKQNYQTFQEHFKNDPLIPEVYWRLGFCEYRLGNTKDSIEILQTFRKENKDSPLVPYVHYLLGEIYLIHGDHASSVKELNIVLNQPKGNPLLGITTLIVFWNYVHLGDAEGANRIFQRLQKLSHFEDEKAFMQWLIAQRMSSEGRITDSLPYYFNILNTGFRERALFQIGKGYFFEGKFREAITNLDILLLEFPDSRYMEESLFLKGECLSRLGNLDQALEAYEFILKQNRSDLWQLFALMQVGSIYFSRDEPQRVEMALKKVLRDFPRHPLIYHAAFQLGNLYFRQKNIVEAISYYSMALDGNVVELLGEASFALGEIFYQQGHYDKALNSFQTAIGHLKETSLCFFLSQLEIGNLQKRRGRYEEAKKTFKIVLDHAKDEEVRRAAKELLSQTESK